ncbi:MAG: hypothetical protein N2C14_10970 [Planctomycetales bacterium]
MRRFQGMLALGCLVAAGCAGPTDDASQSKSDENLGTASQAAAGPEINLDDFIIGEPVAHLNLTIFPVSSRKPQNADEYITLDEGLKSGQVEVFETGASGQSALNNDSPAIEADYPPNTVNDVINDNDIPNVDDNDAPSDVPNDIPNVDDNDALENNETPNRQPVPEQTNARRENPQPPSQPQANQPPSQPQPNQPQANSEEVPQEDANQDPPPTDSQVQDQTGNLPNQVQDQTGNLPNQAEQVQQEVQLNNYPQGQGQPQRGNYIQGQGVSGDVNRLMIVNRSDKPLYLMPGEIIVGGKQDRTIARESIVSADGKPVAVDVFCVEHGRWQGRDNDDTTRILANATGQSLSGEELQQQAMETQQGKFVASAGVLSKNVRQAAQQSRMQQEVWDQVTSANNKAMVNPKSGAFTANYSEEKVIQQFEPYLKTLEKPVNETENIVGVIVAVNGKVQAVDVFNSTPLFRKLWPKLLKSFALDAATEKPDAILAGQQPTCTKGTAKAFFSECQQAHVAKVEPGGNTNVTRRESANVVSFSALRAVPSAAPADQQDADQQDADQSVHVSGYAK